METLTRRPVIDLRNKTGIPREATGPSTLASDTQVLGEKVAYLGALMLQNEEVGIFIPMMALAWEAEDRQVLLTRITSRGVVEQIAGTYGYGNDGKCCSRLGKISTPERSAMLVPGA
jgi:hypothetical protein